MKTTVELNGDGSFISETFLVQHPDKSLLVEVSCTWRPSRLSQSELAPHFQSLDVLLNISPKSTHIGSGDGSTPLENVTESAIDKLVRQIPEADFGLDVPIKVLLAAQGGFVCRSDILVLRLKHSEFVDAIVSLAAWDDYIAPCHSINGASLLSVMRSSPGAVFAKYSHLAPLRSLLLLQQDLDMRLSFPWLLASRPAPHRVAIIGGREMREPERGLFWSQAFFEAALALGISPIVLDNPGHWMQAEAFAHLRGEFIPIDLDPTNVKGLPARIAEALREKQIDGVTTFTDEYVVATAEAAELLGLPAEPAQVMKQAHFKQEMRAVLNGKAVTLANPREQDNPAVADMLNALEFPMIIKPCRGVLSRGVMKIVNRNDLRKALHTLEAEGLADDGILLEPYVEGPELDGNFALLNGKVLFLEVNDNFPCPGDAEDATLGSNFAESVAISSSKFPLAEKEIIRTGLQSSLLKLGFNFGVFHAEARMRNSSMRYQDVRGDGILDLTEDLNGSVIREPELFLIEVNARPPGAGGNRATLNTYGVDLGALQLLRAIDDKHRFQVLSEPYRYQNAHPGDGGGAQWWTAHSMIPVHRERVFIPENFFDKVYELLPEIRPYVTRAELYADPGKMAYRKGCVGWVGYLLLHSRQSRRHVLEMYHRVVIAAEEVLDEATDGGLFASQGHQQSR